LSAGGSDCSVLSYGPPYFRILICVVNDGGYGSEFHKLRADGIDDSLAVFGRPAFERIARGFDLRGNEIRDVSVIPKLFADFVAQGESEIWNIQIADKVLAPMIRQTIKRGHGNMRAFRAVVGLVGTGGACLVCSWPIAAGRPPSGFGSLWTMLAHPRNSA
jgi:hypothetical protein